MSIRRALGDIAIDLLEGEKAWMEQTPLFDVPYAGRQMLIPRDIFEMAL